MRKTFLFLISFVIAAGFLVYMTTFTVRFTDTAVVSTFGKVTDASVIREPGMKLKWPAPIQSVTLYDTRARFLGSKSETQQTADDRQIIVEAFLTWRVSDPLKFNQNYSRSGSSATEQFKSAERTLNDVLRSAMSEVSKYRLGELFTPTLGESKLPALEGDIMNRMKKGRQADSSAPAEAPASAEGGKKLDDYGIEVLSVGINKVVLPENTTNQVFERMKATMETRAARAESEGQAAAVQIRSAAESEAKRIEAFANLKADTIRNMGDLEAAQYLKIQQDDPELAEFLKKIEFIRTGLGKKVMLVLPTSVFGVDLLNPESLRSLMNRPVKAAPTTTEVPATSDGVSR